MNRILRYIYPSIILIFCALISKGQSDSVSAFDNCINNLKKQKEYKIDSVRVSVENEIYKLERVFQDSIKHIDIAVSEKTDTLRLQIEHVEDSIQQIESSFFKSLGCLIQYSFFRKEDKLTQLQGKRNKLQVKVKVIMSHAEIRKKLLESEFHEAVSEIKQKEEETINEIEKEYEVKINIHGEN